MIKPPEKRPSNGPSVLAGMRKLSRVHASEGRMRNECPLAFSLAFHSVSLKHSHLRKKATFDLLKNL